jgi:hypothetical protein
MTFARFRDAAAKVALVLGVAGLVLAPAAALILPAAFGRTVQIVATPNEPEIVEVNRAMWSKGEPVAPIYGTPIGKPMRIVFPDMSRLIVPAEDPSLTLYTVDKSKNQNPLQAQTLWFFAKFGMIGSAVLVGAGMLHFVWKRWRKRRVDG